MRSYLQIAFTATALASVAGSLPGKAGRQAAPEQTVSIYLYNDAEVNPHTLHWARADVNRLFRAAGIQITWRQVSGEATPLEGLDKAGAACAPFNQQRYIVMRLISKAPATVSPVALGLARPFARERSQVLIFWDRLEALRGSVSVQDYTILGHVMAHEIGHVLLHSAKHSAGGVMQTRWTGVSWHLASQGLLTFGPEEAERMRAELARFQNCAAGTQIASSKTR